MDHKKVMLLVEDLYEEMELWYPKYRLEEAGYQPVVAGPEARKVYSGKHGYPCRSDASVYDLKDQDFMGIVIPGGFAPDKLRRIPKVLELVRNFMASGKLVAHICHGGWICASAEVVSGFRLTSTPGIKDDLVHAGALWTDEPVVVDRNMVSSRRPDDLPLFMAECLKFLGTR
ncbi:type 1 glutamine amidotransferase domain-containing protein [Thermanaerovibrio acidaminovorans]|jgi:protease I|uniref:Intracellular protease, PfpI family n=1 Tax=Thermanaerovibrio acidaminovorans (strain ATCC 49978 / DSM 6589 / Su883) TaxID=525903 RepID=D1B7V5_THEAS|nr:type 1 glutamine amidotransferase domain-containing protein [Thermanaerovibrio acidaminovorans]ACZ18358.1 intracellular protease, PfpI family [Thermanaerovibrio acidaminovorans DSM 6589]